VGSFRRILEQAELDLVRFSKTLMALKGYWNRILEGLNQVGFLKDVDKRMKQK
jgi:hypothetical protein